MCLAEGPSRFAEGPVLGMLLSKEFQYLYVFCGPVVLPLTSPSIGDRVGENSRWNPQPFNVVLLWEFNVDVYARSDLATELSQVGSISHGHVGYFVNFRQSKLLLLM